MVIYDLYKISNIFDSQYILKRISPFQPYIYICKEEDEKNKCHHKKKQQHQSFASIDIQDIGCGVNECLSLIRDDEHNRRTVIGSLIVVV